jgi:hypothetical protein
MLPVLSINLYSREEAITLLKSKSWFLNSPESVREAIMALPEICNGFVNDLADRPEAFGDFVFLKISDFTYSKPFAFCTFDVKSTFTGQIYKKVVTSWDKGTFHSIKGIILLETNGKISHFVVRTYESFSASKVLIESVGSIFPPENFRSGDKLPIVYLESELKRMMRLPDIKISKCIDLGQVYPDQSMSDNIVSLFAAIVKVKSAENFNIFIKDKKYDDGKYTYSFIMYPIEELLNFLSQTQDSFSLAMFGRLQALNVIKL